MRKASCIFLSLAAALPLLVASCSHSDPRTQALIDLRDDVEAELGDLKPGDWIIIGTAPTLESAAAVKSIRHINVMATNVSTLRETLDLMEGEGKLSPRIWVCRELEQTGTLTPGTARMRTHLKDLLTGRTHFSVDERVIAMQLKLLGPERKVLIIRTDTTLPHSSIGVELDYADRASVPATPATNNRPPYRHADLIP